MTEQTQLLGKQLERVDALLKTRMDILDKRKSFLSQLPTVKEINPSDNETLINLANEYQEALNKVSDLNQKLVVLRTTLNHALQQQLSSRRGLPEFRTKEWLDLGQQFLWVPPLTFQMIKSLVSTSYHAMHEMTYLWVALLVLLEVVWVLLTCFLYRLLGKKLVGVADHEFGHINLKWLGIQLLHRNMVDAAILLNIGGLFGLCGIPSQHFMFLINLGCVWLFFKFVMTAARLVIVESVHDHTGTHVRLYYRLKWVLSLGGIITAITVCISQLPAIYEVKDLLDRIFLSYVLVLSGFFLKSWDVVPSLILPYIDERRTYLKKIVRLLGLFIPLLLLTNSAMGLLGFVNLVWTIAWYESIFLCVMVSYLVVRGLLIELMDRASYLLIRHVSNGWLWTEAF